MFPFVSRELSAEGRVVARRHSRDYDHGVDDSDQDAEADKAVADDRPSQGERTAALPGALDLRQGEVTADDGSQGDEERVLASPLPLRLKGVQPGAAFCCRALQQNAASEHSEPGHNL